MLQNNETVLIVNFISAVQMCNRRCNLTRPIRCNIAIMYYNNYTYTCILKFFIIQSI